MVIVKSEQYRYKLLLMKFTKKFNSNQFSKNVITKEMWNNNFKVRHNKVLTPPPLSLVIITLKRILGRGCRGLKS
jgi:hypothetical protein